MREILFRGKTLTNRWVEGAYYKQEYFYGDKEDAHIIITSKEDLTYYQGLDFCIVIPETIGQYTGLTDKNDTKIFEGDIVNVNTNKDTLCHRYEGRHLVIRFDEYHRFVASGRLEYPLCNHYEWEIIGNIHDNPELLKGGAE